MCAAARAYSHHYIIILYTCNSRGTRRRYKWCTWPFVVIIFFFCPSFYSRSFDAFYFLSDIVNNLIHYYYFPDTWCIVIATIGAVYRERPLRQSPLSCTCGLFSPQSLGDSPLGVTLLANDRRPIATDW